MSFPRKLFKIERKGLLRGRRCFCCDRISQITPLPRYGVNTRVNDQLLVSTTRIPEHCQKGFIELLEIAHDGSIGTFQALHAIHKENMEASGAKENRGCFQNIRQIFDYDTDWSNLHGKE